MPRLDAAIDPKCLGKFSDNAKISEFQCEEDLLRVVAPSILSALLLSSGERNDPVLGKKDRFRLEAQQCVIKGEKEKLSSLEGRVP